MGIEGGLNLVPTQNLCLQNGEVFALTYGSVIRQLIADLEDLEDVNKQLDKMCGTELQLRAVAMQSPQKLKPNVPFVGATTLASV